MAPGRRPNFFILGAPKCGTTALATYLSEHPRVFVSTPKEPNYFARHLSIPPPGGELPPYQRNLSGYLRLFEAADDGHLAVGEASTRYLRSARALREIREFGADARFLVMLRHPVELARSWHAQKLYEGQETEKEFARAWTLQRERADGRSLPRGLQARDALLYERIARIGSQVERLFEILPPSRVKILFLEDLSSDPRRLYESVLAFLDVPSDGRRDFPVVNPRRRIRWPRLQALLRRPPRALRPAVRLLRRTAKASETLRQAWRTLRDGSGSNGAPSESFERELHRHFEAELATIERITGRRLST